MLCTTSSRARSLAGPFARNRVIPFISGPHTGNELAREEIINNGYSSANKFPRPKSATFSKPKMTELSVDRQNSHSRVNLRHLVWET
jgi:hypothetical protein